MNKIENPYIDTFTGHKFHFLNFGQKDIHLEDIAHSLSCQCRFVGHCHDFYSVAQHSVRVSQDCATWESKMWGLFHDAAEAYIGDISSPLKSCLWVDLTDDVDRIMSPVDSRPGSFVKTVEFFEEQVLRAIAGKFSLPWPIPKDVHKADHHLIKVEMGELWEPSTFAPCWMPRMAESMFLDRYYCLEGLNAGPSTNASSTLGVCCGVGLVAKCEYVFDVEVAETSVNSWWVRCPRCGIQNDKEWAKGRFDRQKLGKVE